ncbi:MAG TPA: ATP synthase F0 subunit B [Acidobacteriota bacterium]|nr:ATP synthase F0 subunit B [Acidobacteriota bacterium]
MINPDWTLLAASLIFLITLFALNRLLFQPLLRVLDVRREKTVEMRRQAQKELEYHQALLDEYTSRIKQEKQAGYRLADSVRAAALQERQRALAEARAQAEQVLMQAKNEIQTEQEAARQRLRQESEEVAQLIAARVLQRT